jgi:hypothetical protein
LEREKTGWKTQRKGETGANEKGAGKEKRGRGK